MAKKVKEDRKRSEYQKFKIGDKVWWYNPQVILEVINVNETHAHLRNIHGAMNWVLLEKLKKVIETATSPTRR